MILIPLRLICAAAITILLATQLVVPAEMPAAFSPPALTGSNPYRVGEVLEYSVSWSKFMLAATMKVEVRKRGYFNDFDSYHVVMQAQTAGLAGKLYEVSSKYESYVNADTLLPHKAWNSLKQPKREKKREYRLEPDNGRAILYDGRTIPIPPATYDFASLFYTIRSTDFVLNKPVRFTLIENDKLQTLVAEAKEYEDVETDAGRFKTVRIAVKFEKDGIVSDSKKLRVYLSNDSKKIPVLITVDLPLGSIRIELVSAR